MLIIAIDGPAASGKSSAAEQVAKKLNFKRLDSGLIYRALTYLMIKNNLIDQPTSEKSIKFVEDILLKQVNSKMFFQNQDITENLRTYEIDHNVGIIAQLSFIRERTKKIQRSFVENLVGETAGVIVDGRDIGTIVFPEANLKVFITASPEIRADRRAKQLGLEFSKIYEEIIQRDSMDMTREIGPLKMDSEAIYINNDEMDLERTTNTIIDAFKSKNIIQRENGIIDQ